MAKEFFNKKILGLKNRGCRTDPQTGQSVQFAKHSGDIVYNLSNGDAVSKKSEYRTPTRERLLNPVLKENLNEVGQNKHIIKRTAKKRYIRLD